MLLIKSVVRKKTGCLGIPPPALNLTKGERMALRRQ